MNDSNTVSSYLAYLPAIFQQDPLLGRFLLAFELLLTSDDPTGSPLGTASLATTIEGLADYFDPQHTTPEFLPWLANWVALTLRADWEEGTRRDFIQHIVPLYRLRGTLAGLQRMLELYTHEDVSITDSADDGSTLPDHFFQVRIKLNEPDLVRFRQKQQIARAIIDQEKPAHTFYALQVAIPTMRLVSAALQQREKARTGTAPPLLILGRKGNTILGTEVR